MALSPSLEDFQGTVELLSQTGQKFKVNVHLPSSTNFGGNDHTLDCPDCEDSQFCHSSEFQHLQLQLGIRYPNLID
ncbi:hypothetical protein Tco_0496902 [Tanacetum coccineum]